MKKIFGIIAILLLVFSNMIFCQISVIVNKNVPAKSISKEKIIDIYTLDVQNWNDGSRIIVIDYKGDNEAKARFYGFLDFSFSKMQKVWLRKQFSGAGKPPLTFHDYKEVIDKVASTPGAIGYIPSSLVNKDVNTAALIDNK